MQPQTPPYHSHVLDAFVALAGTRPWRARMAEIGRRAASGPRTGAAIRQRHAFELAIERLRSPLARPAATAELRAAWLAADAVALAQRLGPLGRARLRDTLRAAISGDGTLVPLFHTLRTASLQVARGFAVTFDRLAEEAGHDLLITRGTLEAEIACEVVSAEAGRLVQRTAWSQLADGLDADVRIWLARHPGRYLLKLTLPQTLHGSKPAEIHGRIRRLLHTGQRRDADDAAVLRLDPLVLHGADARTRVVSWLRHEFGPEAHLAVIGAGNSVFAMVARAARPDEVAVAVHRRLVAAAASRLSGTRPGILAVFVEDTDHAEWRSLRERLELEGEARKFLAHRAARHVIAVTCASRFELFGTSDAAAEGELRFRNPANPAARTAALAPAVLSSV